MLELLITATAPVHVPHDNRNEVVHYREYAKSLVSSEQWKCLDELWDRESSWRTNKKAWRARNKSSGAYGIPQALPAKKMYTAGLDAMTNPITQINWGLNYIKSRYGSSCRALAHHDKKGWY